MSDSPKQLVEHFFRHESANLIAVLTRAFGIRHLELIEDMVQVAMMIAMNTWKQDKVPDNPAAWMHRVAKNRVIDALRRKETQDKALKISIESVEERKDHSDLTLDEERISDSLLQMIFVCCHPHLDRESQIALTLKTLCGFGISEIANGLLLPKEIVKKRIQRARKKLAAAGVKLELPSDKELRPRLLAVHDVLYVMFNEGYSTSQSIEPIRDDICEEASRLCYILCESGYALPSTFALLSLLLFQSSRLEARTSRIGDTVLLEDQDRTQWDRKLICSGLYYFEKSKTKDPTTLHYEAAIAMQHCTAPSLESTPWNRLSELYTLLIQLHDSPIYRLNHSIVLSQTGDTDRAIVELQQLKESGKIENYPLLDCALAFVFELMGNTKQAIHCYNDALSSRPAPHEISIIKQKLLKICGHKE